MFDGLLQVVNFKQHTLQVFRLYRNSLTFLDQKYLLSMCYGFLMSITLQATETKAGFEYFEKHIRPMIHNECLECHGEKKQKGGLAMHQKALALAGGDLGKAIIPGKPSDSLLIEAIERKDEDLEMPPKKELSKEQVQHFRDWIAMGAPWPEDQSNQRSLPAAKRIDEVRASHWAFQKTRGKPLAHPDHITEEVEKKLAKKGFVLSRQAKPQELIRRVYQDLIGLPPSIDEVERFVSNPSDEAFAKMVDELLARPEYGERWGRHWLDVARYADTMGAKVPNQSIHYPNAYTYRDYVIKAFNEDKPFDQFIHEQIAADLMHDYKAKGHENLAALGFIRVGPNFLSIHDKISDRVDVVTRGFLGLTVSCARCHDHKTDPVTIRDYYALYGVFNNIETPNLENSPIIGEVTDETLRNEYYDSLNKIEENYSKELKKIKEKNTKLIREEAGYYLEYFLKTKSQHRVKVSNSETARLNREALKLWNQALPKLKVSHRVMGPYAFMVNSKPDQMKPRLQAMRKMMFSNKVNPKLSQAFLTYEKTKKIQSSFDLAHFYGSFLVDEKQWGEVSGKDYTELKQTVDKLPLTIPENRQNAYFTQGENAKLRKITNQKVELAASALGSPHRAMVIYDKPSMRGQHVFIRGDAKRRGDNVDRRFLEVLTPMTGGEKFNDRNSGRLDLAKAITHPDNPLTSRVMMNRLWTWHFGKSLVSSPSDYGMLTAKPLQIDLLDRLAKTFISSKWSIKKMHRLIMNSKVYKQSSDFNAEAYAQDPGNHYLWRFNRQRLSLEQMRDSMLAVSGSLKLGIGGKPYDIKEHMPRRTVYARVDRNMIPDVMVNFDAGNLSSSLESRPTTSVPQQSLFLLNDEFVLNQAEKIANHEKLKFLEGNQWVRGLFHLVYSREPTPKEIEKVRSFVKQTEVDLPDIREYQWSYGYGKFDDKKRAVESFNKLAHFNGKFWRMGATYPHPKYRYISLSASGGHTGSKEYSSVRRWTSPLTGKLEINGILKHTREGGDGVYGIIWSNKKGLLGEWHCYQKEEQTLSKLQVEKGEVIDFIAYCGKNTVCDTFTWDPELFLSTSDDTYIWRASEHFSGPMDKKLLNKKDAIAHILLMSNEFHFVD